jgi:hypothetical protein
MLIVDSTLQTLPQLHVGRLTSVRLLLSHQNLTDLHSGGALMTNLYREIRRLDGSTLIRTLPISKHGYPLPVNRLRSLVLIIARQRSYAF